MATLSDQKMHCSILIVDDTLENLQLLASMLESDGYTIRKTTSGKLALQFVQLQPPDLILLDINMPEMDGYQVCEQLKASEQSRHIPVVFISAIDHLGNKLQAFEVGAADYITKPFQEQEVLVRVKNQLLLQAQKRQLIEQNQRLEQEIEQRRLAQQTLQVQIDREQLLGKVIQHVRQSLDLDEILWTTVSGARQLLQTDRALVYRATLSTAGTIVSESVAHGITTLQNQEFPKDIFPQENRCLYQQGLIRAIVDIDHDSMTPYLADRLRNLGVKSKLVAPIVTHAAARLDNQAVHESLSNDQLWGLLVLHQCRRTRQWQPQEIELLKQLADQVAIAIQQSELYQQVQSLNENLERQVQERTAQLQQSLDFEALLQRITDKVRDSLDEDQILQTAVEELATTLKVDCCDSGIYNAEHTISTIQYEATSVVSAAKGTQYHIQESLIPGVYQSLLRGEDCQFCFVGQEVCRSTLQYASILACSIFDDQGVLGDLWLYRSSQLPFEPLEIRLVRQVANQCAIALRQSRLYQAVQAQVQELEELNQLKDDFLSTVSHELRTPIANITMATKMLELSLQPLGVFAGESNAVNRYFKILQDEGHRELSLINDLLDMTRLDAGVEPLHLTQIKLQCFIPHLAEPFIERTRNQQQHLEINIPENLPPFTTDLSYLERILTELLHNACKYTPVGEKIILSAQATSTGLEIWVCNSGVEITVAECDRIFDKFYRIPNNDPWKHGGTGLGLALVKKLTEQLRGNILVESSCGKTTFKLQFSAFS